MEPLTTSEMRSLELNAEYLGVDRLLLMENAGAAVARVVKREAGPGGKVVVLCGPGNNGGDGMVAARHLADAFHVEVVLIAHPSRIRSSEARRNLEALRSMASTIALHVDPRGELACSLIKGANAVIDAIFGTGLRGPVASPYREVIEEVNRVAEPLKVAVDVPSGLNPDTGEVHGVAVKADVTVTFHAPKPGLLKPSAKEYVGELIVEPIGIPPEAAVICGPGDVAIATKARRPWSKKGDYGRVLIVGGSELYTGAPALAALASLRLGADLAVVYAPEESVNAIRAYSPNLIVIPYSAPHLRPMLIDDVVKLSTRFDVIILGPGLGLEEETVEAVLRLVEKLSRIKPMVVDADALKALSRDLALIKGAKAILTPHAGELRLLTGVEVGEGLEERMRAAKELASATRCTVLLKGHVDVVSDGKRVKVNRSGNPGMTVGGTGDVLTGVAATLLAWTGDPFRAACAAAFLNGLAGDLAAMKKGYHLLATDLLDHLPEAYELALKPAECRRLRPPVEGWEPQALEG
ncbi:MAG: bifunctional ADP-dependent NAD(P)H-hydrate dehydratase/NAD(P)H-hydrate epimerase [Thermoprotei archaeon]|nr:MAG: bifunctional ADP-dependent NAD(P)H-hydrate dehydratase/NAD(P)H-hydrate epimerase [Thermoprotei archaeon]